MSEKRVTMADLARRAGLSKSTISRALSGDPRVKPETRKLVEELARRLNYQPHPLAKGLARKRTYTLGLAIPSPPRSFSNPFYLEFIGGVGDYAITKGYTLFFTRTSEIVSHPSQARSAATSLADGYILTEPELDDPRVALLQARKKPFVFLGRLSAAEEARAPGLHRPPADRPPEHEADAVWVEGDNVAGAQLVVEHLLSLGHRQIGCIAGSPEQVATHNRVAGFKKALAMAGLAPDEAPVVFADFTEEGGRRAADELLETAPHVTAIFASNDLMAIGAIHALRARGKRVPEEISVAGFDGISAARFVTPRLTTAAQPIYQLGETAARLLIDLIEGVKLERRHVSLPCTLLMGESTAPPPGA